MKGKRRGKKEKRRGKRKKKGKRKGTEKGTERGQKGRVRQDGGRGPVCRKGSGHRRNGLTEPSNRSECG